MQLNTDTHGSGRHSNPAHGSLRRRLRRAGAAALVAAFGMVASAYTAPAMHAAASGLPYKMYVGYADDLRANPANFPTPWSGSPNIVYEGSAAPFDTGAIMVANTSSSALSVTDMSVDLNRPGPVFDLSWCTTATPCSIPAGSSMIIGQTTQYNFDTSDPATIEPCGTPAPATLDPPKVTATIGGVATTFVDSGHVLDTGGFDLACKGNESTQWTPIGKAPCFGSTLALTPAAQVLAPSATAAFQAKFADSCGNALADVSVNFAVTSGPNAGTTGTATTNSSGIATFSYSSTLQGIDYVQANVANTVGTISSNTSQVTWETATLNLSPTSGLPGSTISFTGSGYTAGETVNLSANATTGPALTSVIADGTGAITGTFVVPVPSGGSAISSVVGVGATSGKQGWAAFSSGCTDDWTNASGGDFNNPANWSTGAVPGSSAFACIILPGTYTVSESTSNTVAGLVLGPPGTGTGAATLTMAGANSNLAMNGPSTINPNGTLAMDSPDGNYSMISGTGTLTNNGTIMTIEDNGAPRYIRVNVVNNGTLAIGDFDTRVDSGNTIVSAGAVNLTGMGGLSLTGSTFNHTGGTITNGGSFSANGGTFISAGGAQTGNPIGLSNVTIADSKGTGVFLLSCSNNMSGTIPSGQTVTVQGNGCGNAQLTLTGAGLTNSGTLNLDSTNANYALITGSALVNKGTMATLLDGGGTRYIRSNLTNTGKLNIYDYDTRMDSSTTTTTSGTVTVETGGALSVSGGTVTQTKGTLANKGSLTLNGVTLAFTGGVETTNPAVLLNSTFNDGALSGAGSFILQCGNTLNGTIPVGQRVTIQGNPCGNATTTLGGSGVVNNGTLVMDSTNGNYALIGGAPLTNNGAFTAVLDAGGTRYVRANLTNATTGTVTIGDFDTRFDSSTTTVNNGTFTVVPGASAVVSGGTFSAAAGTIAVDGALTINNVTLDPAGGTLTGNAALVENTTINDSGTTGALLLQCGNTLNGTIPAGQTLTVQGNAACGSASLNLASAVTNNGTLTLTSTNTNYALISGSALTNNGTFSTVQGGGGTRYIRVPVVNAGTFSIGAADTRQDSNTATTNSGTTTVLDGASLNLNGCGSTFGQGSSATLGVVADAASGPFGISGCGAVTVGGTLSVTTVGNPAVNQTFAVVAAGSLGGTFATVSTGATTYSIAYSSTAATLTRH